MLDSICIDARIGKSGIGVYTRNLIRELSANYSLSIHSIAHQDQVSELRAYCRKVSSVSDPIYSIGEQWGVARAARGESMLHVPHYNIPLLYRGTLLVTIHDLTHIECDVYQKSWKSRLYGRPMLREATSRANHIFTVSHFSKKQIVDHLGVDEKRITVVHNGVDASFCPGCISCARERVARRFNILQPFLLYVGNLKPHKNLDALLYAYANLPKEHRSTHGLVLAGAGAAEKLRLQKLATKLNISPTFADSVTLDSLVDLYRAAELVVQPSLAEGFGLTVLESMACGTPVASSNAGSLPEVAGDAALYFSPYDAQQLSQTIERFLDSQELQAELREKGLTRAKFFTWKKVAGLHFEIYQKCRRRLVH